MRRIGLTGGIATGKSYVVSRLREAAVPVIDADVLAREAVAPGSEGLAAVVKRFGHDILTRDGTLDRPRLGRIVFQDPAARRDLESIVHPFVRARIAAFFREVPEGVPFAVADIPLLYETGGQGQFDKIIVVASAVETQLQRIMARDSLPRVEAERRLAAQLPIAAKVALADYVITTDGSKAQTDAQVAGLVSGAEPSMSGHDYLLGHSEDEHERLQAQADLFAPLTEDLFRRAELAPGMNILDIGAGAGDVSIMAARFAGPSGSVVGVERAAESVARANERVRRLGFDNISFIEGDLATLQLDRQFDAMVGRLIVLYLPDRARVVERLLRFVRPGGIVALQEMDMTMGKTEPEVALFNEARDVIVNTTRLAGFEPDMGTKLPPFLRRLGLRPRALMGARVESGPDSPVYTYLAETIRSVLPLAEKFGVTTAAEIAVDTLAVRLKHELTSRDAVFVLPPLTGAWARR